MINKNKMLLIKKLEKLMEIAEYKLDIIDKDFYDALECLHNEIRDLPSEIGWILPTERLPVKYELDNQCRVLATLSNGSVEKVRFNFGFKEFNPTDNVIVWQPIPKPYTNLMETIKRWFGKN
ncbi:MAG: hypothetical protein ACYDEX_19460 [Mobilitalea sp.]